MPTDTKARDMEKDMFHPKEIKQGLGFVCLSRTYESHNMTHRINATVAAKRVDEVTSRWLENRVRDARKRNSKKTVSPFDVAPDFRLEDGTVDFATVWEFMMLVRSLFTDAKDFDGAIGEVKNRAAPTHKDELWKALSHMGFYRVGNFRDNFGLPAFRCMPNKEEQQGDWCTLLPDGDCAVDLGNEFMEKVMHNFIPDDVKAVALKEI